MDARIPIRTVKRFLSILLWCWCLIASHAATITGPIFLTYSNTPYTGTLLFRPLSTPLPLAPQLVTGGDFRVTPATNGVFSVDLAPGNYRVTVGADKSFVIDVPTNAATYTLLERITNSLAWNSAISPRTNAYSTANATIEGVVRTYSTQVSPVVWTTNDSVALSDAIGLTALSNAVDTVMPQTGYKLYTPTVTRRTMLDPNSSPWQYNHDTTIAWYQDRWFAQWNANTDKRESQPGQVLLQSTSTDFLTWSTPVEMFHSSTYSDNPVTMNSVDTEWQPGLIRVGTELWSIWSRSSTTAPWPTGYKILFSRLTSPTGKWVNTELNITYTDPDGVVYYGFATQNPIQLKSGRVVAPIIWNSQDIVSPPPAGWTATSYFWINKKRAGCIYTDDNGATWKLGGITTLPGNDHALWEPVIQQTADGTISMWCRNLDYKGFGSDKYLLWAQGYSDGAFFDPLTPIRIDVSSSRLGMLYQAGKYERHIGLHNDWKSGAGANFVAARRNASLFFSRSGAPDMVPGINFSEDYGSVSYPQGDIHDGKIYVMWTQSQEPNYLMTSVIDPAPSVSEWYISPRQNDAVNPFVVWTNTTPTRFIHNVVSEMESVRSTSSWTDTNKVTVGAWVYKSSGGSSTTLQTIVDNRLLQPSQYGGFIWGTFSGVPLMSLVQTNGTGINYSFSTLSVPFGEWVYMGLSIDISAATATCYVVRANGTETTETKALGNHVGINGATLYIGRAINTSSWARHVGDVRRIRVINGVAASANEHRYLHGTEQSALGVTDWAGTESNPGTPSFDYNAADGHAGLNDATWLAEWTQTGQIFRGYASPATLSGTNTLLITGSGSAGVEMPRIGVGQQYVFGSQLFITNKTAGADQCFLTIGDLDTQITLISRASNPTKFEVHSKITDSYTEVGDYIAGKWLPLTVKIGGGYVSIAINKTNAVFRINEQQPRFYIGQGHLGTFLTTQLDGFHLDMDKAMFHVAEMAQPYTRAADPQLRTLTVQSSNVVALVQGVNPTLRVLSDGGAGFRPQIISEGSVPTISFLDSDSPTKTNHFIASGNQILLMNDLTQSGAGGILSWDASNGDSFIAGPSAKQRIYATGGAAPEFGGFRYNGTYTAPTAVQSGDTLSTFGGAGHNGSFTTGYKAGVLAKATETWTSTANGSRLTFEVTPNGSTSRAIAWSIDQDSALVHESSGRKLVVGFGSPEGVVTAPGGSQYWRRDGGAGTSTYVKETVSGNTGWVGIGAAGGGGVASSRQILTVNSLTGGGDLSADRTLQLVNDSASPGANKVYGTDGSGVRGWKADPAGGGLSDGDKGEITVTSGVWTLDDFISEVFTDVTVSGNFSQTNSAPIMAFKAMNGSSGVRFTIEGGNASTGAYRFQDNLFATLFTIFTDKSFSPGGVTADPGTLSDGKVWYRDDTDKLRLRANGVSESLATESWASSTFAPQSRSISTANSLTGGGNLSADRTIQLVNDSASPGANKVYGTDASGVKGWKNDPAGSGGGDALVANPLSQFAATTSAQLASVLSNESGTGLAVFNDGSALTNATINGIDIRGTAGSTINVGTGGTLGTAAYTATSAYQAADSELAAIAGLTSAADTLPYFTGAGTAGTASLTAAGRSLIGGANAAAQRTTLGLAIGTDVQAFDSDLSAVAGLSTSGLMARTGAGTAAARTLTAPAAGVTVSNGDGVSGNPTLALANDLSAVEGLSGTGIARRTGTDAWSVGTTVSIAEGGTGQTSAKAAFDALNGAEATVASASTTDIGAASSDKVSITGTTTITSFGTATAGIERQGRFTGALILTYNATSLILPGGGNITTAAGDSFRAYSLGSGNWVVVEYVKANGQSVKHGVVPIASKSADYTLVITDAGFTILHPSSDANSRTFTIPSNASVPFDVGTVVTWYNDSANTCTIAITSDTLTKAGAGTTGSVSLPSKAIATAQKITSTSWVITGNGI